MNEPKEKDTDITESLTFDILNKLTVKVSEILKAIQFPGYASVHFNIDTFDFTIQDAPKGTTNGGGYCGIINAVERLALREILHEHGQHEIGILLMDSVFTQLSESQYTGKGAVIRDGLLQYMIDHQQIGQLLIVDQREKMPDWIMNHANCHVIEFTKATDTSTYGFLNDVFAEGD